MQKHLFWSKVCSSMGGWRRHPRTHLIFSGIVQFKETHSRDPKTPLLAHGVQWYGWLGRHPRTHIIFLLAFCSSKTPILGMQKHLFWPMVCSGLGGWGATPEPKRYWLALCSSKTLILGMHKHLFCPKVCSGMGGWGATPEPT